MQILDREAALVFALDSALLDLSFVACQCTMRLNASKSRWATYSRSLHWNDWVGLFATINASSWTSMALDPTFVIRPLYPLK